MLYLHIKQVAGFHTGPDLKVIHNRNKVAIDRHYKNKDENSTIMVAI